MEWDQLQLLEARDEHDDWLMRQPGVEGSSVGYDGQGNLCIKILTDSMGAAERDRIRERLRGLPVAFQETGPIVAQDALAEPRVTGAPEEDE